MSERAPKFMSYDAWLAEFKAELDADPDESDCPACCGEGEHECECGHEHDCEVCDGSGKCYQEIYDLEIRFATKKWDNWHSGISKKDTDTEAQSS